jgi:hypothetical protein
MVALTRRILLSLFVPPASTMLARQAVTYIGGGMASRGVKAAPRGKPSGLPFRARFTDVAEQAGLKEIVIAAHPERADYIIEVMSCGVAFFD